MTVRRIILECYRERRDVPFAWRTADCLQWCGMVTERLTGRDPGAELRQRYASEIDAKRIMVEHGWRDMGDAAASIVPEIPLAFAHSGDWAQCVDDAGRDGLGIVCDAQVAVCTEMGLGLLPLAFARRAFRP